MVSEHLRRQCVASTIEVEPVCDGGELKSPTSTSREADRQQRAWSDVHIASVARQSLSTVSGRREVANAEAGKEACWESE